jgi:glycosyltransferase involved in cell wall biosynthesis
LEASDFFIAALFQFSTINFGGFGTAMIEALAVGMPVISNNIIHFEGNDDEINLIGVDMPTKEKLEEAILFMYNNYMNYTFTREMAEKYFNIKNTRAELVNKYRELRKKYFGD